MRRLAKYRRMRRFDVTSEPSGRETAKAPRRARGKAPAPSFVVQLHHARRRHFDFRLEWGGTLRSWAIPRGPSLDPTQKRLAVEVEDHPVAYGKFEGDIPQGQYGAGHVDIWDEGRWQPEDEDVDAAFKKGHLHFTLHGERLRGRWSLVRTHLAGRQPQWLLIKAEDEAARAPDVADDTPLREWTARQRGGRGRAAAPRAKATRKAAPSTAARTGKAAAQKTAKPGAPSPRRRRDAFPREVGLQLARLVDRAPGGADWIHEVKYDGYRFLALRENRRVKILSRNGIDWTAKLPALRDAILDLHCRDCIIDGELVAYDEDGHSRFDLLQKRFADAGASGETIRAMVFDLLYLDGADLREQTQDARKRALHALLKDAPLPLQRSETMVGEGPKAFAAACKLGLEGIVSKSREAPYREGRGGAWLKIKCVQSDEFVIVGYTPGQGARAELGSLLLARPAPRGQAWRYVGRVGSGLSEDVIAGLLKRFRPTDTPVALSHAPGRAELRGARPRWVRPQLVVEVEFRAWTEDGILRQASVKGLRPDKSPADVAQPHRAPQLATATDAAPRPRRAVAAAPKRVVRGATKRAARRKMADMKKDDTPAPYPFTHPQRLIFTAPAISKAEIGVLYADIAAQILPGIVGRPLALLRCPDGVGGECFFQKHLTPGFRDAVHAAHAKAKRDPYVYIEDLDGLLALVQMNVVEIHAWGAPLADPDTPDRIVFDLDPAPDVPWSAVKAAAQAVRERLAALKLASFLRASGGKGLHVVVPLSGRDGWDAVKSFAHAVASSLAQEEPQRYLDVASKTRRRGRIFIDYLRNARGATSIASYSLRARPGAPIAVPLAWDELGRLKSAAQYHFGNIRERIARHPDPWRGIDEVEQALPR
ncbi:DNA ligase D [Solimonas soli]|uniref:DNA ligase D n=1 Tax=Solimonas soli TaxID=413479 RepID=UPI0004811B9E|nr:DNA ligase D [Solimonas soli]